MKNKSWHFLGGPESGTPTNKKFVPKAIQYIVMKIQCVLGLAVIIVIFKNMVGVVEPVWNRRLNISFIKRGPFPVGKGLRLSRQFDLIKLKILIEWKAAE